MHNAPERSLLRSRDERSVDQEILKSFVFGQLLKILALENSSDRDGRCSGGTDIGGFDVGIPIYVAMRNGALGGTGVHVRIAEVKKDTSGHNRCANQYREFPFTRVCHLPAFRLTRSSVYCNTNL